MKFLITFFLIAFLTFSSFAQTSSPKWNKFLSDFKKLEQEYNTHYPAKDYHTAAAILDKIAATLDTLQLSEKEKQDFNHTIKEIYANVYYNLACLQSILNQKKQAITSFEKSIKWGYTDYQNALNDTDLNNIRKETKFVKAFSQLKQYDKLFLLQQSGNYLSENYESLPVFKYEDSNNRNLVEVKNFFKLDSIAGSGDEISKIRNIMLFVANNIKYDGSNWALCEFDAIDFYNYHKSTGKGINCRHKAMTLNELYLAMGFKSRYVTCMPKDDQDTDCHVINSVYSETLKKWLWMDPSHGAFVMDDNNNLLSIEEVREGLKNNQSMKLNAETKVTKIWYLDYYMAKNLYWIQCTNKSQFNTESRYRPADTDLQYISLIPSGFDKDSNKYLKNNFITHNPAYFWKSPE
ncbi:transglutaminase-like domain-containing protein [Sphingobacterium spiritivorum]|uniref:transglutaminase-like domain-containing protein n=1 Tax=Sphingobacterium spiritivorum TaxID=258 RepID=UPI0019185A8D|nr:transglutaminase-like domain-containing protein [Sphingobacterium spiritivorum]QQT26802.1 transglutaminase domain-containing protein [Sphingobacterium spiritivorum]